MNSKIIFTILTAVALSSCSKFLDVKPSGRLIPTESAQLANLMNASNVYDWFFLDNNIGTSLGYRGDNFKMSATQEMTFNTSSPNIDRYAGYTFFEPMIDFNAYYYYYWNWNYRTINIYNTIIDGIGNLGATDPGSKTIVAQTRAARAYNYLVAAVLHGPMWDPAGDNSVKVMPYRTTSSATTPNPQLSDTEEMFAKIWEDLDAGLQDIPEIVGSPIWANKAAVHAIRAQFFMYKRDWPNMLKEANDSWVAAGGDATKLIYDFNDFRYRVVGAPPTDGTDHEVTLQLEYAPGGVANTTEPFNEARGRENLFWRRAASSSGIYPSDSYLNLFDTDEDLRYKMFMLHGRGSTFAGGYDDGIQLMYYRANKIPRSHGITYPEVLLMRAEAYARTNKLTEALADLNLLRRFRYERASGEAVTVTDLPGGAGLNQDQLLHEILKERRRELPYNSFHRIIDIKRYFHDTGKPWSQTSLTHNIGPKEFSVTLNKHSFTLPITNEIIRYNTHWGLTPTPGLWNPFVK